MYVLEDTKGRALTNAVGSLFTISGPAPSGRIVIVKNAAADSALDPVISVAELCRDIWWYHRSGVDFKQIWAERQLERVLVDRY